MAMPHNATYAYGVQDLQEPNGDDDHELEGPLLRPLLLDRICPSKEIAANSLLRLPLEIIGKVVRQLHRTDVPNLALVSSDCRQLARSRQFVRFKLDYDSVSHKLLDKIIAEHSCEEDRVKGALGACVRQLKIATSPVEFDRHEPHGNGMSHNRVTALYQEATDAYYDIYLKKIEMVVSKNMLPNLDKLIWGDNLLPPRSLLLAIVRSPIRRFKFASIQFGEPYSLPEPIQRLSWPLKRLHLKANMDLSGTNKDLNVSSFHRNFLALCSQSLETLILDADPIHFEDHKTMTTTSFRDRKNGLSLSFPRLRNIIIRNLEYTDASLLEVFLGPNSILTEAELHLEQEATRYFMQVARPVPSLKTFRTCFFNGESAATLDFLRANPQIQSLEVMGDLISSKTMEDRILPCLCQCLPELRELSLIWHETDELSDHALEQIGSLRKLEGLLLEVNRTVYSRDEDDEIDDMDRDEQNNLEGIYGPKHWMPDHRKLLSYLRPLTALKRLAFSNDAYESGDPDQNDEFLYYRKRNIVENEFEMGLRPIHVLQTAIGSSTSHNSLQLSQTEREVLWFETLHERRMQRLVTQYKQFLPSLDTIWLGRIEWTSSKPGKSLSRNSVDREPGAALARRHFGIQAEYEL